MKYAKGDTLTIMDGDFGPYPATVIAADEGGIVVAFKSPKLGRIEALLGSLGVREHNNETD